MVLPFRALRASRRAHRKLWPPLVLLSEVTRMPTKNRPVGRFNDATEPKLGCQGRIFEAINACLGTGWPRASGFARVSFSLRQPIVLLEHLARAVVREAR